MKTYIVLLRGVMPTGKNRVPMAQLRQVLADAGFQQVRTWIQSGNVVLQSDLSAKELEVKVHQLIKEYIGPELAIVVRTSEELRKMLDNNPFQGEEYLMTRVFFVSFQESPPEEKVQALLAQDFAPEKLSLNSTAGYMYIPQAFSDSKLSNNFLERKLKVTATTRNFNTISKMIEWAEEA
ncbi:DUF1697 domain-containing protein [Pontibacter lucknowensis]|uniref:Uncharacterized conserved protein, DUF1697 family n=1 Tax=Pontibacter lucknowensis TaxID=1077936 RepID=A0A1N6U3K1_9BACT|nr:DUF1697 domain-containing protein [Pontibacter lucknowensis]SIQ60091.1 Uncharacterized conserved protein, DUF1697 family [Pontibacter lucknowensis]